MEQIQPVAFTNNVDKMSIDSSQSLPKVQINSNQNNNSSISQVIQYTDQECRNQLMDRAELIACLKSQFAGANRITSPATREEIL